MSRAPARTGFSATPLNNAPTGTAFESDTPGHDLEAVVETIRQAARSGRIGAGRIFALGRRPVPTRTDATGSNAI
jgi:hypothetical protein